MEEFNLVLEKHLLKLIIQWHYILFNEKPSDTVAE